MKDKRGIKEYTPDEYMQGVSASVQMQVMVKDSNGDVLQQETINEASAFEIDIPAFQRMSVASIKVNVGEVTVEPENE